MARRADSASLTRAPRAQKPNQRERLVDAMIELCARSGYEAVSIAQVSAHAGVSSGTFYEQFASKEDCLLVTYQAAAGRLLGSMAPVGDRGDWTYAARAALSALFSALQSHPDAGRVLLIESRGAGPRLAEARGRALEAFERQVEAFLDRKTDGQVPDVPATALVGAVRGVAARALRDHAVDGLPALTADLLAWIESYAIPAGQTRSGSKASLSDVPVREPIPLPGSSPVERLRIPRGRHRLPASVVTRSQRLRLIYATAEVTMKKGYTNTTVADLVAAAGVSREVFYEHFTDRRHAFLEALDFPTQPILDACAAAYFSGDGWPDRVWRGLDTLITLIVSNPAISHLRLIECYAAGPAAVRRAEDITRAFTVFLEEGYRFRAQAERLPRLCSESIASAIFEIIQRQVARGEIAKLGRTLPQIVYVAIAPFMGPEAAMRFVSQMGSRASSRPTL
jgi:AcrR family transcriptional regulator